MISSINSSAMCDERIIRSLHTHVNQKARSSVGHFNYFHRALKYFLGVLKLISNRRNSFLFCKLCETHSNFDLFSLVRKIYNSCLQYLADCLHRWLSDTWSGSTGTLGSSSVSYGTQISTKVPYLLAQASRVVRQRTGERLQCRREDVGKSGGEAGGCDGEVEHLSWN